LVIDVPAPARLDATLSALADPTRRAILRRLSRGEARVTEIAAPLPMSLNAVSKHIRVLERARLVRRRRSGRDHFLSADLAPMNEAAQWMDRQRRAWGERLDALAALLEAEDAAPTPPTPRQSR
jgi:DNA-binding transcriptional ArsR family regulator